MDAQQFLEEFGYIANAPGGLGKLRELVIQLAISGRLVERIESEVPASQAIAVAGELRNAYEAELDLRATRMQPPLHLGPFPVPDHWQWTRLEQICLYIQRGKSPKYVERSSTHVISQKCVQWSGFDLSSARFVADDSLGLYGKERFLCAGDLLWNSTGTGTAGRVAIYQPGENVTAVADSHVTVVRLANCSPRYLWCVIASPWVQSRIEPSHPSSLVSGTTQQVELNTSTARALPIPLPPIEEQSRIVAKVDELMGLCDKLESQQQARRKLQNNLRQSVLQAVASATSPHELQTTWARSAANFGRLFHAPEDVAQLRDLILDLAVHGLLVHQSDADEPIAGWLAGVKATKADLVKQRLISKQTALADLSENEYPFPLPKGWIFVRLGQITNKIGSGSTPRGGREVYVKEGIPFLRSQNVWNDGLHMDDVACITPEEHERMSGTAVLGDDVLLNITGASLGRCALVPSEFGEANVSQHVTIIRPTDPQIRKYLHLCILSPYTQTMIWGRQVGMAREGLSKKVLEQFEIPLPPIEEQHRIVARVAELMRFCDGLQQQLQRSNELAERLAATSVACITGIAAEQEEEPMKAPQTELIAPLRLGTPPNIKAQAPLATILARHNSEMNAKDLWQRFGGEIDAFYAQLKTEVAHGWILEPAVAEMREKQPEFVSV